MTKVTQGKSRRVGAGTIVALAVMFLAGCASTPEVVGLKRANQNPYFTPTNFTGDTRLPVGLHRVVMLPVFGGNVVPAETAISLTEIFAAELQKQLRFEVVRLSPEECRRRFGSPGFSSVGALPADFLANLGREFGAEAVLFVDITSYRAYRPLALGVRAKLATVEQTRLLWGFDEVFSADDPQVAASLRHFYGKTDPSGIPMDPGLGGLQSPSKFASYVAAASFNTLPPR